MRLKGSKPYQPLIIVEKQQMAGSASMFSGALLGLVALDQGVSIAAAALAVIYAKDSDHHNNIDPNNYDSSYTNQLYASCFVFAAAGLTFFFAIALIGCLNRRNISVTPSVAVAAIIMALQVAVGAAYAVVTCQLISPFGPHGSVTDSYYESDTYYNIYVLGLVSAVIDLGLNVPIAFGMMMKALTSIGQDKGYPQEITMTSPMA